MCRRPSSLAIHQVSPLTSFRANKSHDFLLVQEPHQVDATVPSRVHNNDVVSLRQKVASSRGGCLSLSNRGKREFITSLTSSSKDLFIRLLWLFFYFGESSWSFDEILIWLRAAQNGQIGLVHFFPLLQLRHFLRASLLIGYFINFFVFVPFSLNDPSVIVKLRLPSPWKIAARVVKENTR